MKAVYRLEVGDQAPTFDLPSRLDEEISLEDFGGKIPVSMLAAVRALG